MDIKLFDKEKNERFKFRVNGILLNNDKILAVEMNKMGFMCCPGGHVMIGEDTMQAMEREYKEETGIGVKIEKLVAIVENFFKSDVLYHELSFFYLLRADKIDESKQKDFSLIENDNGKLINMDYSWLSLDKMDSYDFLPLAIKNKLKNRDFNTEHIIFHGDKGE